MDDFSLVSPLASVQEAIHYLIDDRVKVLAVVDDDTGTLLGSFSQHDLRGATKIHLALLFNNPPLSDIDLSPSPGIGPDEMDSLSGKLFTFLDQRQPRSLKPATVSMDSTVGEVSILMAEEGRHYVWVIDSDYRPITVVTLTDFMRLATLQDDADTVVLFFFLYNCMCNDDLKKRGDESAMHLKRCFVFSRLQLPSPSGAP